MFCLTRLICFSIIKQRIIRLLFLALVLFTLMVLIFSNIRWLPGKLARSTIQIQNALANLSARVQLNTPPAKNRTSTLPPLITNAPMETRPSKDPQKRVHTYGYVINEPDKCKDIDPFLILLITVERWQKQARQAIRITWGKEDFLPGVRILRLFLLGKDLDWNDEGQRSLVEESQMFHDIILHDYLDTYYNLTTKVINGLNWISTYCPNASYVMKTDSDMFVNTEHLVYRVLKPDGPPRLNYFTGHLMTNGMPIRNLDSKWYVPPEEYPEESYPLFCSGTGYVFSGDLARKIVQVSPNVTWIRLEDAFVGLCLDKLGVLPVAPPKNSDFSPLRVGYSDCDYNQIVTSHLFSPGDLMYFWNRLQQNKYTCVLNQ
ncbi:beta-1,3-galactosyltransferase 2-like [Rana temporaria]|uniref:beta-1,3-galactosyltransferase 2-like n=1 Tax=Rana temporaria TaxID=8407 RepID=UPI001AAD5340|nr:beta-1,3-galactosyltransferase 2-like [Rana temporaria]